MDAVAEGRAGGLPVFFQNFSFLFFCPGCEAYERSCGVPALVKLSGFVPALHLDPVDFLSFISRKSSVIDCQFFFSVNRDSRETLRMSVSNSKEGPPSPTSSDRSMGRPTAVINDTGHGDHDDHGHHHHHHAPTKVCGLSASVRVLVLVQDALIRARSQGSLRPYSQPSPTSRFALESQKQLTKIRNTETLDYFSGTTDVSHAVPRGEFTQGEGGLLKRAQKKA